MVQLCLSPERKKMAQWKQDTLKINGIPSNFNLSDFNYYMLHLNKSPKSAKKPSLDGLRLKVTLKSNICFEYGPERICSQSCGRVAKLSK